MARLPIHGDSCRGKKALLYGVWEAMVARCYNVNNPQYHLYGGRGIKVCNRWRNYINFKKDMAPRPLKHFLDRTNNNGNYTPSNCRWVTPTQSGRNTRNNVKVKVGKQRLVLAEALVGLKLPVTAAVFYGLYYRAREKGHSPQKSFELTIFKIKNNQWNKRG